RRRARARRTGRTALSRPDAEGQPVAARATALAGAPRSARGLSRPRRAGRADRARPSRSDELSGDDAQLVGRARVLARLPVSRDARPRVDGGADARAARLAHRRPSRSDGRAPVAAHASGPLPLHDSPRLARQPRAAARAARAGVRGHGMSVRLVALALAALVLGGPAAPAPARGPARLTLPSRLPRRRVHVPILMYHRVDALLPTLPAITRSLTVEPTTFAQEMHWLLAPRRHTITQRQLFAALMHGKPLPAHPVMITFDDGYRDVYQRALPTLRRLHLQATEYVITERISGPDPSFLDWQMLRVFEHAGVAVGSHTVSHADLRAVDDQAALAEPV